VSQPGEPHALRPAAVPESSAEGAIALALAGKFAESVEPLRAVLRYAPANVLARAYLGLALHGTGRHGEASAVLDYEGGVVVSELRPGASRDGFNRALSAFVKGHPSLAWAPPGKATHGGWQTGELLNDTAPIATSFKHLLQAAIDELFLADGEANGEMARLRLSAWGLCLSSGGFQEPHVHQAAILSGVYYVSVPDMRGPPDAGSLRFSRSVPWLPSTPMSETAPPHTVKPEDGMLVIFPSYFWHETIPFRSKAPRISVAFDLIPEFDE